VCAKPVSVAVTFDTEPVMPETAMVDGYGAAIPLVPVPGMAIEAVFDATYGVFSSVPRRSV